MLFGVGEYNKTGAMEKQAEVENQLKRRYDLIPKLVETVRGYAKNVE